MARILLGILIWAVLVAPALCSTGVLEHPCECPGIDGCGHEGTCPDDPCSLLTPDGIPAGRAFKATLELIDLVGTVPAMARISVLASGPAASGPEAGLPPRGGISFPASDIPLRI